MLRMASRRLGGHFARLRTDYGHHDHGVRGLFRTFGIWDNGVRGARGSSVTSWQLPSLLDVIDTVLNLLFRCPHKRMTRPITPASKAGVRQGDTYVVCLECGKQFTYDLNEMRVGNPVALSPTEGVLPTDMPKSHKKKVRRFAALASAVT